MAYPKQFDLAAIENVVFADDERWTKIADDYQVRNPNVQSTSDRAEAVITAMEQETPSATLLPGGPVTADDGHVFQAALNAIGSSGRSWSAFLRTRGTLADRFGAFTDPRSWSVGLADAEGRAFLADALGGWAKWWQAGQIRRWADRLSIGNSCADRLRAVYRAGTDWAAQHGQSLSVTEATLVLAARISITTKAWPAGGALDQPAREAIGEPAELKCPGMLLPIATEFLRNLGMPAFKPDRHICRLVCCWDHGLVEGMEPRARELAQIAGTTETSTVRLLQVALAGVALTPQEPGGDPRYNRADNLVWLLESKVVTKGKQCEVNYLIDR
ncbi:hypothetical protein EK0264_01645 [Epidermidibacterium keratini]|uniref:Uncharacterized protein n=1 Tax=Epidermidibacterium keratini TaxID=1891644 RepID=A0A7L4YIX0_9ACTN|nr:hypothetical protein [Epidermidibacterium keratini]QHB99119.1 hypothetical protein EK0264_01645 [Epidermidibacterium keratini]